MGKFLKVVVVILFLVSIGTAVLAYMNFNKRTMLVDRTEKLEAAVQTLATTLNAADPTPPDILPDFVAKDVQEVSDREIATPDTSRFWDDYKIEYETSDIPKLNIRGASVTDPKTGMSIPQIRQLYFLDGEGKRVKTFDGYQTTGAGTMAELLDKVQDRASKQSRLLVAVSSELKKVREELEATIGELNTQKRLRRQDLVKIRELNEKIGRLEQEKSDLQASVNRLETVKAQLTDQVNTLQQELATQKEEYETLEKRFRDLDKQFQEMRRGVPTGAEGGEAVVVAGAAQAGVGKSTPGVKGTIVHADSAWPFVIVKLTPEAIAELTVTLEDGSAMTRPEEYMVRRKGMNSPSGELVSRIRIQSIRRDGSNIAIADEMTDWQQTPPAKGDEVYF